MSYDDARNMPLYKVRWWIDKLNEEAREKEKQAKEIERNQGNREVPIYPNSVKYK